MDICESNQVGRAQTEIQSRNPLQRTSFKFFSRKKGLASEGKLAEHRAWIFKFDFRPHSPRSLDKRKQMNFLVCTHVSLTIGLTCPIRLSSANHPSAVVTIINFRVRRLPRIMQHNRSQTGPFSFPIRKVDLLIFSFSCAPSSSGTLFQLK